MIDIKFNNFVYYCANSYVSQGKYKFRSTSACIWCFTYKKGAS